MSNKYKLVNPQIKGEFKTDYTCSSHLDAGKKIWERLSRNFVNNVPQFAITIQNIKDGKYHNLLIEETIENKKVKYTVAELTGTKTTKLKSHLKKLDKIQSGGRKRRRKRRDDDDDDDFDDDDDDFDFEDFRFDDEMHNRMKYNLIKSKTSKPLIWWWWYTPTIYPVDTFFIPTFVPTLHPYIEIIV